MNTNDKKIYNTIKDYIVMSLGLMLYVVSWRGFIYSHDITSGGLAGFSSVISWAMQIDVSWPYNIINIALMVLAIVLIGWKFTVKTTYSVIFFAIFLPLSKEFITAPFLQNDTALAVILGSMGIGSALGIVFSVNGSTGGTDIIAMIINKYRSVTIGRALIYIDAFILFLSYLLFRDIDKLVYSIVQVTVTNLTVDFYLNGYRQSIQFFIISNKYEEISKRIITEVNRGCTVLDGKGAFSGNEVNIIMVIAKKTEAGIIFRIVKEVDPKAFISQSLVRGVYGQGFDAIKAPKEKKKKGAAVQNTTPEATATTTNIEA